MAASSRTKPVVLIIQRDDDSREMYQEFFLHHGLVPVCPADAIEALTLAASADVIVTGILLPGPMDGFEFITRLRSDPRTRHKPIIVVTSWAWQTEKLRAQDAGCDMFLTKPCLPDELLRHVRDVLTSPKLRRVRGRAAKRDSVPHLDKWSRQR